MDEQEQQNIVSNKQQEVNQVASPSPFLPPSHKKLIIGIVTVFVLIIAGSAGANFFVASQKNTKYVACTTEAKICPDGSSVGRTGPNCEFAECPVVVAMEEGVPDDWQTYRNEEFGNERYELGWGTVFSYQRYSD